MADEPPLKKHRPDDCKQGDKNAVQQSDVKKAMANGPIVDDDRSITLQKSLKFVTPSTLDEVSFLEALALQIPAERILAIHPEKKAITAYFADVSDVRALLKSGVTFDDSKEDVKPNPVVAAYTVLNVPPTMTDRQVKDVFQRFCPIFDVEKVPFLPDSPRFAHVLSHKRRLIVDFSEVGFLHIPYSIKLLFNEKLVEFTLKEHCFYCQTDYHSVAECLELENDEDFVNSLCDIEIKRNVDKAESMPVSSTANDGESESKDEGK